MTTDHDFELQVLKRVIDWHDSPSNAPRTLDLSWQDAVSFFGLPADTPQVAEASWERLYDVLDALQADHRLLAELYVNRVRHLRPGYRGAVQLQADAAAELAAERTAIMAEREAIAADSARLAAERDALEGLRASLDAQQDNAIATRRHLEQKSQALDTRAAAQEARQAELDERQAHFDRDRAIARRDLEADQMALAEEMRAARGWRFAGVLALTLAALAGLWLGVGQGWFLTG